jgi:hypothetical protein
MVSTTLDLQHPAERVLTNTPGLILAASIDDEQSESDLLDIKAKVKKLTRVFNSNSATEASIESDQYTIQ